MTANIPLTTTIVLITGGNQGIGLEIGTVLSDLPSYHIILGSRNPANGESAVRELLEENPSRSVSTVTSKYTSCPTFSSRDMTPSYNLFHISSYCMLINNSLLSNSQRSRRHLHSHSRQNHSPRIRARRRANQQRRDPDRIPHRTSNNPPTLRVHVFSQRLRRRVMHGSVPPVIGDEQEFAAEDCVH